MSDFGSIVKWIGRSGKRVAITVVGFGLIIVGLAIIPIPGPWTILLSLAGLAVLGTEYAWARRALSETKRRAGRFRDRLRRKPQ